MIPQIILYEYKARLLIRVKKNIYGQIIIIYNINNNSIILFQVLGGILTFFYPGFSADVRIGYLNFHVFFGLGILVLSVATAFLGFFEELKEE